ncbi:MAG: glucosyltransferase domain-containing protein, partial [Butyrivibrio sp.]|nr:glucosyltransferase domain-containing protein [Butyrivibrio sp.]
MGFLGMLLLLSPNISSTFTYYYCMVPYVFSYFLGICTCWLIIKNGNKWIIIIGGILIAIQCSLYQAYVSVTIVVALLYLIFVCFTDTKLEKILARMLSFFSSGLIGIGIYLVLLKIMRIELVSSRGFDKMGSIDINKLPLLFGKSYAAAYDYFFGNSLLNNSWLHRDFLNLIIILLLVGMCAYLLVKRKIYQHIWRMLLIFFFIILLPVGLEIMVIAAPDVDTFGTTGILLVPAMSLIYMSIIFFQAMITEHFDGGGGIRVKSFSYAVAVIPVIWNLLLFTAAFENVMWLNYQRTYSLCEKISNRIEQCTDGCEGDIKIMITGNPEHGNYPYVHEELRDIVKGSLAVKGLVWEGGWLSNVCYQDIFRNYLNLDYQILTAEEYNAMIESKDLELMGIFPAHDSVKQVNGVIVIKLSND